MSLSRMTFSMSEKTAYVRSARIQSRSLRTSYRICTPWLGRPTSYASGYISAQRTRAECQSLTVALSSPPTYWIGLLIDGRSGSRRGNTDSTDMGPRVGAPPPRRESPPEDRSSCVLVVLAPRTHEDRDLHMPGPRRHRPQAVRRRMHRPAAESNRLRMGNVMRVAEANALHGAGAV